jgi:cytidylate kinase
MKYKVITISREFAAYGRTIAKRLAEELGLEWYDKDFVKKTVEESGFELEMIQKEGES